MFPFILSFQGVIIKRQDKGRRKAQAWLRHHISTKLSCKLGRRLDGHSFFRFFVSCTPHLLCFIRFPSIRCCRGSTHCRISPLSFPEQARTGRLSAFTSSRRASIFSQSGFGTWGIGFHIDELMIGRLSAISSWTRHAGITWVANRAEHEPKWLHGTSGASQHRAL